MLGWLKGKREGAQVLQGHRASPGLPAPRLLLPRENKSLHSFEPLCIASCHLLLHEIPN